MRKMVLSGLICSLLFASCAPIISKHGFVLDNDAKIYANIGTDNKTTLLTRYGNPSQTGTFEDQTWYYISATQSQKAFYKEKTEMRNIVAISFDDGDNVNEVRQYSLLDGRIINYSKDKTPTRGREVTFLEQIFGSVGRAPVTLPGQEPNLPTAAGGPRTQ